MLEACCAVIFHRPDLYERYDAAEQLVVQALAKPQPPEERTSAQVFGAQWARTVRHLHDPRTSFGSDLRTLWRTTSQRTAIAADEVSFRAEVCMLVLFGHRLGIQLAAPPFADVVLFHHNKAMHSTINRVRVGMPPAALTDQRLRTYASEYELHAASRPFAFVANVLARRLLPEGTASNEPSLVEPRSNLTWDLAFLLIGWTVLSIEEVQSAGIATP